MLPLWLATRGTRIRVERIKGHPALCHSPLLAWHAVGNQVADFAAGQVCLHESPTVAKDLLKQAQQHLVELEELHGTYNLIVGLARDGLRTKDAKNGVPDTHYNARAATHQALLQWAVLDPEPVSATLSNCPDLSDFSYGKGMASPLGSAGWSWLRTFW